jgi:hypothetical protein
MVEGGLDMSVAAVSIRMRTYMSIQHIISAALFSRHAHELEVAAEGKNPVEPLIHNGYVTSSIIACVAFLEACINELFADVGDQHQKPPAGLDPGVVKLMSRMWQLRIPKTGYYPPKCHDPLGTRMDTRQSHGAYATVRPCATPA